MQQGGRACYSWEGEDVLIGKISQDYLGISAGFYVDVGAHHPFFLSNTQYLYERGWRGVNIDATPGSMNAFREHRPEDINLELGVSPTPGILTFSVFSATELNGFLPEEVLRQHKARGFERTGEIEIETRTLSSILSAHAVDNIDLLSIDVEGMDENILRSLDFQRWRPKLIIAEVLGASDMASVQRHSITLLLAQNGYTLFSRLHFSAVFMDAAHIRT
jgi:FkbM family methyltransferase